MVQPPNSNLPISTPAATGNTQGSPKLPDTNPPAPHQTAKQVAEEAAKPPKDRNAKMQKLGTVIAGVALTSAATVTFGMLAFGTLAAAHVVVPLLLVTSPVTLPILGLALLQKLLSE